MPTQKDSTDDVIVDSVKRSIFSEYFSNPYNDEHWEWSVCCKHYLITVHFYSHALYALHFSEHHLNRTCKDCSEWWLLVFFSFFLSEHLMKEFWFWEGFALHGSNCTKAKLVLRQGVRSLPFWN